ncbi:MAG: glycine cleavage system protein H [Acidimicrobiales bacterium]
MADLVWRGCVLPDDLLYDVEHHVWVRDEGTEAVIGMTDVAQTIGGRLVQVGWREPGRHVRTGRPAAVIESAKWVGPFVSPVNGVVVANNRDEFERDIVVANRDPYGKGWFYRLRLGSERLDGSDLLPARAAYERYREFIEVNDVNCMRCADPSVA